MKLSPSRIFLLMSAAFVFYSAIIYTMPLRDKNARWPGLEEAANGKLVWQKYNCQACHQIYGLGGYLGPDLTNILTPGKGGDAIVRSVVRSGTRQMPAFEMSDAELNSIITFLTYANQQGTADPRNFHTNSLGMIESK